MKRRGEFQLIADLFAPLARTPGALGLRDDAALLQLAPDTELVLTTDTVIADVHFRSDDPPGLVARKALRVNLSDLAAKGAQPIAVLQALTLGAATDDGYLEDYARGLGEDLATFGLALLGGDTTAHRAAGGPLTVTFTALGSVPRGTALLRGGAREGDLLCVSGTIGDAAVGLRVLQGAAPGLSDADAAFLVGRYRLPEPRVGLGPRLRGIAAAAADVSDGLCADVGHICEASGVAAEIQWASVPRSAAVNRCLAADLSVRDAVLGGGDDYEIAFTVPESRLAAAHAAATAAGIPIAVIGAIVAASGQNSVRVLDEAGGEVAVKQAGYTHRRGGARDEP